MSKHLIFVFNNHKKGNKSNKYKKKNYLKSTAG